MIMTSGGCCSHLSMKLIPAPLAPIRVYYSVRSNSREIEKLSELCYSSGPRGQSLWGFRGAEAQLPEDPWLLGIELTGNTRDDNTRLDTPTRDEQHDEHVMLC